MKNATSLLVCASKSENDRPLSGVIFEPLEEVKKELSLVPDVPQVSLSRHEFSDDCEAAINEQIKYTTSFYHTICIIFLKVSILCLVSKFLYDRCLMFFKFLYANAYLDGNWLLALQCGVQRLLRLPCNVCIF